MAGYSGTPLWQKLGYKTGQSVFIDQPPPNYHALLDLPGNFVVSWLPRFSKGSSMAHIFTSRTADLGAKLKKYRKLIANNGFIWISWPKKSSGVPTDITEDRIRELALPLGWVDVKVCAVDEVWSGLKLMIRKSER